MSLPMTRSKTAAQRASSELATKETVLLHRVNPGIGDCSFIHKHKQFVDQVSSRFAQSAYILETFRFKEIGYGGLIYRLTITTRHVAMATSLMDGFGFVNETYFTNGALADNIGELIDNNTMKDKNKK